MIHSSRHDQVTGINRKWMFLLVHVKQTKISTIILFYSILHKQTSIVQENLISDFDQINMFVLLSVCELNGTYIAISKIRSINTHFQGTIFRKVDIKCFDVFDTKTRNTFFFSSLNCHC